MTAGYGHTIVTMFQSCIWENVVVDEEKVDEEHKLLLAVIK